MVHTMVRSYRAFRLPLLNRLPGCSIRCDERFQGEGGSRLIPKTSFTSRMTFSIQVRILRLSFPGLLGRAPAILCQRRACQIPPLGKGRRQTQQYHPGNRAIRCVCRSQYGLNKFTSAHASCGFGGSRGLTRVRLVQNQIKRQDPLELSLMAVEIM